MESDTYNFELIGTKEKNISEKLSKKKQKQRKSDFQMLFIANIGNILCGC